MKIFFPTNWQQNYPPLRIKYLFPPFLVQIYLFHQFSIFIKKNSSPPPRFSNGGPLKQNGNSAVHESDSEGVSNIYFVLAIVGLTTTSIQVCFYWTILVHENLGFPAFPIFLLKRFLVMNFK